MKKVELNASLRRLIDQRMCNLEAIERFLRYAEKLKEPHMELKIRESERTFRILGDQNRLKMYLLLAKKEMCVCELEKAFGMPQATVSHDLSIMEQHGLISRRKEGRWAFYKALDSPMLGMILAIFPELH